MNQLQAFKVNTPKVVHETIDGEVVIVNLEKGDYFSLTKAGADIWDGITRGISRVQIVEEMVQRYDCSLDMLEMSVNEFIDKLQQEELIISHLTDEGSTLNTPAIAIPEEKLSFEPPSLQKYTDMEELLALDPIHEVDDGAGWPNAKVAV